MMLTKYSEHLVDMARTNRGRIISLAEANHVAAIFGLDDVQRKLYNEELQIAWTEIFTDPEEKLTFEVLEYVHAVLEGYLR